MRVRSVVLVVLAVSTTLGAAGCTGIPTSGPVQQGDEVLAAVDDPFIRVLPRPPAVGLSPSQVVQGFLAASASFDDDHAVARLYLTPDAAQTWDATTGVTVYDDERGFQLSGHGKHVEVTARAVSHIDSDGLLVPKAGQVVRRDFTLTKASGQWRISKLQQGLLLSRSDVDRSFRPYDLFFLTPQGDRLVPDPVFIPVTRPGSATSLVRALLDGPTPWLAPAVRTAIPAGTTTTVDSVPVENGVASVDLSAEALGADSTAREQMAAQLTWTLTQLPEVTAVSISVEGSPLQLPNVPVQQTEATWASYDPDAAPTATTTDAQGYLVRGDAMAEIVDGRAQPVPGVLGSGAYLVSDPTATQSGDELAALTQDRRRLLLQQRFAPDTVKTVLVGTALTGPSFDSYDRLWTTDRTTTRKGTRTVVWVRLPDGRLRRVQSPGLADRNVTELRLSPDGTRAAVVVTRRDGTGQLLLGRIRSEESVLRLDGLRRIEQQLVDVRDVAWRSASSLVVLGREQGAALQPFDIAIEGSLTAAAGSLAGIDAVAAGGGFPLIAGTSDGRLWQDTGLGWRALVRGSDPAYPG